MIVVLLVMGLLPTAAGAQQGPPPWVEPREALEEMPDEPIFNEPCVQGFAGPFPCHMVDLLAFLPPSEFGSDHPGSGFGGPGNDSWGWTDPETGQEWALVGMFDGSSFIDITDPRNSVLTAIIPAHQTNSLWSDIKVFDDHAFIVKEGFGNGMQVFDLTRLRDIDASDGPVTLEPDAHYDRFGNAHNVAINEGHRVRLRRRHDRAGPGGQPVQDRAAHGRHQRPAQPGVRRLLRRGRRHP